VKYIFWITIIFTAFVSCEKTPEQNYYTIRTLTATATSTITATITSTRTPVDTATPVVYRFETDTNGWQLKTPDIFPQSLGFIDYYINTESAYIYTGAGSLGINCHLAAEPMARRGDLSVDLSSAPAGMYGKTIMARVFVTADLAALTENPYTIMSFIVSNDTSGVIFSDPISMTTTGWNDFLFSINYDAAVKMVGIRVRSSNGASALTYDGPIFVDEINW
jgi:hypothetical protein